MWGPTFHFGPEDILWWERTRCLSPEGQMIILWEGRLTLLGACLFLERFFVLFHPSPSANSEVRSSIIIFLTSSPVCPWAICSTSAQFSHQTLATRTQSLLTILPCGCCPPCLQGRPRYVNTEGYLSYNKKKTKTKNQTSTPSKCVSPWSPRLLFLPPLQ